MVMTRLGAAIFEQNIQSRRKLGAGEAIVFRVKKYIYYEMLMYSLIFASYSPHPLPFLTPIQSRNLATVNAMVFRRAHLNLGYLPDKPEGVNGLAELIEFNAAHNPDSTFCLQIRAKGAAPCRITFAELHAAVERCCAWLLASGSTNSRDGGAKSPAPVGILLGSDITIFIYTAALLRLGTPVSTKN